MSIPTPKKTQVSVTNIPLEHRQLEAVFKTYRNTIDIYTEDKIEDKEFYIQLLSRLLDNTDVKISDIYPLGCRNEVIKYCKEDQSERSKIYIVDGDIYLQYKEDENIPNLHILDAYCIENFLVCEESLCDLAYRLDGRKPFEKVKCLLNIPQVLDSLVHPLTDLFFYYSIQMELYGQYQILHIDTYLDDKKENIDNTKIENKIADIRSGLKLHGKEDNEIDYLLEQRKKKFPYNIETLLTIVSAKNYIIPYFRHMIKKKMRYDIRIPNESWKFNLVGRCDIARLDSLKEEIIRVSQI